MHLKFLTPVGYSHNVKADPLFNSCKLLKKLVRIKSYLRDAVPIEHGLELSYSTHCPKEEMVTTQNFPVFWKTMEF